MVINAHLLQQGRVRHAIPDEVEPPMPWPQVIVETGDRIANHLLLWWQVEGEIGKHLIQRTQRQIRFVRRTAPDVIASIDRPHSREDRSAYTGTDTIAANEDSAVFHSPAREMNANARTILLDALKVPTEVVMRWIYGIAQQPLKPIPGCENLRQVLFADYVPGAVERDAFINLDSKVADASTTLLKRFQKLRMRCDTGAAAGQFD